MEFLFEYLFRSLFEFLFEFLFTLLPVWLQLTLAFPVLAFLAFLLAIWLWPGLVTL